MLAACWAAVIPSGFDLITASAKAICTLLTLAVTVKKISVSSNPLK
jgi:hypothetical protein